MGLEYATEVKRVESKRLRERHAMQLEEMERWKCSKGSSRAVDLRSYLRDKLEQLVLMTNLSSRKHQKI